METKEKLNILKNFIIFIVLSLCISGFIWICQGQVSKFLKEITIVNTGNTN